MKKLLLVLVTVFSLAFSTTVSAADRFWSATIFTPAASDTARTLNVAYNVLSTEATDTYTVKLYQNEVEVGSQFIDSNDKGGDSGVFSIALPATGTYKYSIAATNETAGETKPTETKTVNIVDGPSPTVTTVAVNTAAGGQAGGAAAGANNAAAGQIAGAATENNGQVTNEAANTSNNAGSSLGASTNKAKASDNGKWYALIAAAVVAGGAAYYWFVMRRKLED